MNEPVLVGAAQPRDRRVLKLLVAGLVLVLLVGVVGPRLVSGGDDDAGITPPPAVAGGAPPATPEAPGVDVGPVARISARDPFVPVVGASTEADPGGTPEAALPLAPAGEPAPAQEPVLALEPAPVEEPVPAVMPEQQQAFPFFWVAPPPAPAPGPPPVPGPEPRVVRTFGLLEVFVDGRGLPAARIALDGEEQLVAVGQDVAGSYRVLSLNTDDLCGVFLYGDRRFALCQGEEAQT